MSDTEILAKKNLPVIPTRNLVMFPKIVIPLIIGRQKSINATNKAYSSDKLIFCTAQKSPETDHPDLTDVYQKGVICKILQILKMPDGTIRIVVEGEDRAKILRWYEKDNLINTELEIIKKEKLANTPENSALLKTAETEFKDYVKLKKTLSDDVLITYDNLVKDENKIDVIAGYVDLDIETKQRLLEYSIVKRLFYLIELLSKEVEILKLQKKIAGQVRSKLTKSQKEYFLNQELKVIQKELGLSEDKTVEIKDIEDKLKKLKLTKEARKKADYEFSKLKRTNPMSPEYSVALNYLNWITELPWTITDVLKKFNLNKAERILDKDHYGLKKVKQRIIEYLAVLRMVKKIKGQILCFVGPPGVGKTSLGRSIARALDRKFIRLSLGGVRDEAEIRGHRKTYIGAMPGVIIQSMKRVGVQNPVIMLDEIDKMSADFRGDPSAALLEVLDPEQNYEFHDHYLEVGYDLSQVLFITTANNLYAIPHTLRDRMEIITIPGYTRFEKNKIAEGFLIPKQIKNHGLGDGFDIKFTNNAIFKIIENYTREAGVRELERNISSILRKIVRRYLRNTSKKTFQVSSRSVSSYLGVEKYREPEVKGYARVGVANGLAWTSAGGVLLQIEVAVLDGKGRLVLTGKLGDVMKESANAALSYARAHYSEFGINKEFYKNKDIHIHIPEGAIPKDGPSAGITMAVAIISALSNKKVKKNYSMTGEITLKGDILPIGGLEEKLVAAQRAKTNYVIIPQDNYKELSEINKQIKKGLNIIPANEMKKVVDLTLEK